MGRPEPATCPSEDALFRWTTGDLPARHSRHVEAHVSTCAACASQLRAWNGAIAAYRDYSGIGSRGGGERASASGDDMAAKARFDARLRRDPRASVSWIPAPRARWMQAAAALLFVTACMLWLRPAQATLSAEALIAGAVDSEHQALRDAAGAGLVTIAPVPRTRVHAAAARAIVSDRGREAQELARRLAIYEFDWQTPLSARPFQRWRASAATRADALEWVGVSLVRVSTSANDGAVRRAELMLHMPGFRPVAQIWRFADGFEVELRLNDRPAPDTLAASTLLAGSSSGVTNAAASAAASAPRSLDDVEIDLRSDLERAGVVLDRRVAIRRSGTTLVIDGRASAAMARRIAALVRERPDVAARVRTGAARSASRPAGATGGDRAIADDVAPASSGMREWLDRTFGASALHGTFIARARELDDELQDAVAVLDDLGRRYPASTASRLSPESRQQLQRLASSYFARVTGGYERLEAHLAPLIGSVSRRILPAQAPATWRSTPAVLDADLHRLSRDLDAIVTSPYDTAEQFEAAARDRVRAALAAVAPR